MTSPLANASGGPVKWPWQEFFDPQTQKPFYSNAETGETSWVPPSAEEEAPKTTTEETATANARSAEEPSAAVKGAEGGSASAGDGERGGKLRRDAGGSVSGASEVPPAKKRRGVEDVMVYVRHDKAPTAEELGRPARVQAKLPETAKVSYVEGRQDYNIWYDKFLTDRGQEYASRRERDPAATKCNPFTDSGWTLANFDEESLEKPRFCMFFAKGCCTLGKDCKYFHRVPTAEDNGRIDMLHDCFGRERHSAHRDDMDGVGSFSSDCKTLFIGDLSIDRSLPDYVTRTETLIRRHFGLFGPVDSLRLIPNKNIAFIKFKYRVAAEFAKIAMADQFLTEDIAAQPKTDASHGFIAVRWAHTHNRNKEATEADEAEDSSQAKAAVERRMRDLGYTDEEIQCYAIWGGLSTKESADGTSVVSAYPDAERTGRMAPVPKTEEDFERIAEEVTAEDPAEEAKKRAEAEAAAVVGRLKEMQKVLDKVSEVSAKGDDAFEVQI